MISITAPPAVLFVYRLACAEGLFHAKCVSCDLKSSSSEPEGDEWPIKEAWPVFEMSTGRKLSFHVPVSDVVEYDIPPAAFAVYKQEPYEEHASLEEGVALMEAPNDKYIVIEGDCRDLRVPFFLTTGFPTRPAVYRVQLNFQIAGVMELPDVIEYYELVDEQARTGDKYDRMALPSRPHGPVRIPPDYYLPGTLKAPNGTEATVAYSVEEWLDDRLANVVIHSSDASVEPTVGSVVVRRRRAANGVMRECVVGTVTSDTTRS